MWKKIEILHEKVIIFIHHILPYVPYILVVVFGDAYVILTIVSTIKEIIGALEQLIINVIFMNFNRGTYSVRR